MLLCNVVFLVAYGSQPVHVYPQLGIHFSQTSVSLPQKSVTYCRLPAVSLQVRQLILHSFIRFNPLRVEFRQLLRMSPHLRVFFLIGTCRPRDAECVLQCTTLGQRGLGSQILYACQWIVSVHGGGTLRFVQRKARLLNELPHFSYLAWFVGGNTATYEMFASNRRGTPDFEAKIDFSSPYCLVFGMQPLLLF